MPQSRLSVCRCIAYLARRIVSRSFVMKYKQGSMNIWAAFSGHRNPNSSRQEACQTMCICWCGSINTSSCRTAAGTEIRRITMDS